MSQTALKPQTHSAEVHPFLRGQPKSVADVHVVTTNAPKKSALESIAAAKSLFTHEHKRNKLKLVYCTLDEEQRRMLCFCAGLKQLHVSMSFDDFTQEEAAKIATGLKMMAGVVTRFENMAGPVGRLNPSNFCS
ncbi:hypothetical protein L4174_021260 [Photobacterium sp. CCB-ST2H9]|uniref:hypothetical protein n=1 Tax=Photobacterium sp. CCB-ST2H9 TaxID=2912855 RepID=UPI002004C1BF|nr:hypothetical protein [Photobacterium sp. CCB-ST2H9]UTM59237.1 hypothetical protein L4174_021260 [Photobacterium sp. CCB-ST2H9]